MEKTTALLKSMDEKISMKRIQFIIFTTILSLFSFHALAENAQSKSEDVMYKMSAEDVKKILYKANQFEQCVHPEIAEANGEGAKIKKIYAKMSEAETKIWEEFLLKNVIPDIIGEENAKKLFSNNESFDDFSNQYAQFNNSDPIREKMTSAELITCFELRQVIGRVNIKEAKY